MRQRDVEGLAAAVRRRAGVGDDEIVHAAEIAERVLGTRVIVAPDSPVSGRLLRHADGRYRVLLREVGPDANFDVAHELGHYALRVLAGYRGAYEERLASQVGAALIAPPGVVRAARAAHGRFMRPVRPLADVLLLSQTATHLRLGEVLEDGRAVVTRTGNVLHGDGEFWSEDAALVAVARGARRRGIRKARLRGGIDDGRVAICASR